MELDDIIDAVLVREGGFVNCPTDRGGPTCWGITQAVARQEGFSGDMRKLPRATAIIIYRRLYWERPSLADVQGRSERIAVELFDTGVNMGPAVAIGFLQRALNALNRGSSAYPDVIVDGRLGPKTLASLDGFMAGRGELGEVVLLRAMEALQGERYIRLAETRPANEAFLYGWLANRIGSF